MQVKFFYQNSWINKFLKKLSIRGRNSFIETNYLTLSKFYKQYDLNFIYSIFETVELLRPLATIRIFKTRKRTINIPISLRFEQQYNLALMWFTNEIKNNTKKNLINCVHSEILNIQNRNSTAILKKNNLNSHIIENRVLLRIRKKQK